MRKSIFFLLISLFIFSGCGGGSKKTMTFWHPFAPTSPTGQGLVKLVKKFDRENPDISIKILHIKNDTFNNKLQTAIAGGDAPDVAVLDRFVTGSFAHRNSLQSLEELLADSMVKKEDFFQACWAEGIYRDRVYAVPFNTDSRALIYNKDAFRKAGLDPDKPPRNWNELLSYAKKLSRQDDKGVIEQLGFLPSDGNCYLYMWAWLNGGIFLSADGREVLLDSRENVEALEWMCDFYNEMGGQKVATFREASAQGGQGMDPLMMGRTAMRIDGDWMIKELKHYAPGKEYGFAPPPPPAGKKTLTWSGGFALVLPTGGKDNAMAWKLIEYLVSEDSQTLFARQSAQMPALKDAAYKVFSKDPDHKVYLDLLEVTRFRPVTPVAQFYWDKVREATDLAILGNKTPEEALSQATKEIQAELDRVLQ